MARTAKTPKNETEIEENVGYEAETAPKTEVKYSISDDPYLTDEQKDVLFRYEFNKLLKSFVSASTDPNKGTVMIFPNGTAAFVPAKGKLNEVWEYYTQHIRGGSVDRFLAQLKDNYGDRFKWVDVDILVLNN